jgi:hypothetical protein
MSALGPAFDRFARLAKPARERDIEAYLKKRVKELGGEIRKTKWVGRVGAPDRRVMLPDRAPVWVELKNPETIATFPANGHERQQLREINRMRRLGELVEVIGTIEGVEELLRG